MNETTDIPTKTTSEVIIAEITTTSTTTQSHEIILPTVYTPLTSRASSTDYIDQEHTKSFTVQIFTPLPTGSSTAKYDPDATLPPSYLPLSSKAPRMLTSSSTTWPTSTATSSFDTDHQKDNSLSPGQITGIVIGSILGGLLLLYVFYVLCWTRRKMLRNKKEIVPAPDEKYTASSLHLPYDFDYPIHQYDPFYIPDESIASYETSGNVNKPFYY